MNTAPWPQIFLPKLPEESLPLPRLSLKTSGGYQIFGNEDLRMYVCGITPYDSTHLGHAATYLTFDLISRYVSASGGKVSFVENITDIDEPLLERASRDGVGWQDLAKNQVELFQADMTALHVIPPQYFVPATSAMQLVEEAITAMKRNGFVYSVENDLYFDISSFLDRLPISLNEALSTFAERGGDPNRVGKRHPLDPVLWWANRDGEPGWESSHGFGRPGWHIECCVISLHYLRGKGYVDSSRTSGDSHLIDIQGGGSDLLFPHHFMSGVQAEAITGVPFARAYVHTGMIGLNGEKMSKSKGNLVFVSSLVNEGVDPMIIRWALMKQRYSEDRMWTESLLQEAVHEVSRVRKALSQSEVAPAQPLIQEIVTSLSDNLDTHKALNSILAWSDRSESVFEVNESGVVARALDSLLGLAL